MQTFLISRSFLVTAQALDDKRLGKQRVETLQILNTLTGKSKGWVNHPAVKMWKGHEGALIRYGEAVIGEWRHRGFKNTISLYGTFWDIPDGPEPPWMYDERAELVFASHRANLLRKDAAYYGYFGWTEDPTMPYYWPTGDNP